MDCAIRIKLAAGLCNRGPPLAIISTIADRGTRGSAVFKRQLAAGMQSAAVN